jgi:aspartyl protease family protein
VSKCLLLFAVLIFSINQAYAETRVNVVGLFTGKATVMINGSNPTTLSVGQTKQSVKLISADSQTAVLEIDGQRKSLGMGQAAAVVGEGGSVGGNKITLYSDSRGHFFGHLIINSAPLEYVVDTGASVLAMNSFDAKRAGIDYKKGQKVPVDTANGVIVAYYLTVNSIKIDTVMLYNVGVAVMEGGSPSNILLGMSVLNRFNMHRDGLTMTLTKKY